MLFLATPPTQAREAAYRMHNIGLMYTPNMSNRIGILSRVPYWAADTGCYSPTVSKQFDLLAYLKWLEERIPHQANCLFATAPDVVGDAARTLGRSMDILPIIRAMGFKAALVAQDGVENMELDWASFDCLFIGGSTKWKLSAEAFGLVREAKQRGLHTHVGRVNSRRRLMMAAAHGVDSCDGTYLAFGPDTNLPNLKNWLTEAKMQRHMFMGEAA